MTDITQPIQNATLTTRPYGDLRALLVTPAVVDGEPFPVILIDNPLQAPAAFDAFGRLRTSNPRTLFDSKQIVDNLPLFFDDQETVGGGTSSTFSAARASTMLAVSAATAGTRVRQTKRRFNYQPGKGQAIFITFVIGAAAAGITRRVGYFDANNGMFLQSISTGLGIGLRTGVSGAPVDTIIPQASWNVDKFDGTGVSGMTLDPTKAQILVFDFEWLGVGSVRVGFNIDGVTHYAHTFRNANTLTSVYMSTPNLPLRYEIINSGAGGAATLETICATVISEGGQDSTGVTTGVDRGVTAFATGVTTNLLPILSIRLKSTHQSITTLIQSLTVMLSTANAFFRWALLLNPTIGGVDAASWVAITNSALEYDVSRTSTNVLSGGYVMASGYAQENQSNTPILDTFVGLGATIAGVSDQIVLGVQNIVAQNESYFGSLVVRELL